MKVWIHIDGVQEGPYEVDNLPISRMSSSTPVWYEGLPDWMPASEAPLVASYFSGVEVADDATTPANAENEQNVETIKCPPTYLVWSILMTIVCCNPISIIPVITGISIRSKFSNHNFKSAQRLSTVTEWWIMIAIVTSLILLPLNLLTRLI